jgi:hypothetical protein
VDATSKRKAENPPLPEIVAYQHPPDPHTGLVRIVIPSAMQGQVSFLRQRMEAGLDLRLVGEVYGKAEYILIEYREMTTWFCKRCGVEQAEAQDHCPDCGEFDVLVKCTQWVRRAWQDGLEWSDWLHLDGERRMDGLEEKGNGDFYYREKKKLDRRVEKLLALIIEAQREKRRSVRVTFRKYFRLPLARPKST